MRDQIFEKFLIAASNFVDRFNSLQVPEKLFPHKIFQCLEMKLVTEDGCNAAAHSMSPVVGREGSVDVFVKDLVVNTIHKSHFRLRRINIY
jgi:hypothetical protein